MISHHSIVTGQTLASAVSNTRCLGCSDCRAVGPSR